MNQMRPALFLLLMSQAACSNVTVKRIKDPDDHSTEGYRYWLSAPYVMVTAPVEVGHKEDIVKADTAHATLTPFAPCPSGKCDQAQQQTMQPTATQGVVPPPPPALRARVQPQAKGDGNAPPPVSASGAAGGPVASANAAPAAAPASAAQAGASSSPITLVWLPDYCEEYAVSQTNFLSSQTLTLTFGDGHRLDGSTATLDATATVGNLMNMIGTIASAALGGGKPSSSTGSSTSKAQDAEAARLFKHTTITYIKPGLYPLTERKDCATKPTFTFKYFELETVERVEKWEEIAPPQKAP